MHAVQHLMHPLTQLTPWLGGDRRTRLVVIGRAHDEHDVFEIFKLLAGESNRPAERRNWRGIAGAAGFALAIAMVAAFLHFSGSDAFAAVRRLSSLQTESNHD